MVMPEFVGSKTYRYRVSGHRVTPWSSSDPEATPDLSVEIRIYFDGHRLFCGQVITSTDPRLPTDAPNVLVYERGSYEHIDSAIWRAIPIGALIDRTIASYKEAARRLVTMLKVEDPQAADRYAHHAEAATSRAADGRRSPLTVDLLKRLVVPAYITGGRRPVVAVQGALNTSSEFEGSGPNGEVTMDQARKAAQRARGLGLLPPTTRGARS